MSSATPYYFDAVLKPSRSLGRRGFVLLLAMLVAMNAMLALRFVLSGGWPVLPFLGLDIAGVLVAFALNYRRGRVREHVQLDRSALTVTHLDPRGSARNWSFEPAWVRVAVDERPRGGRVAITTNGKGVVIAEFLTPRERKEVASALNTALRKRLQALADAV